MSLPKNKRVPGNRHEYDPQLESEAYDVLFYETSKKDFIDALPHLRKWFQDCFPDAKSLIDLGCGSGEMISCVKDIYDVIGVDFSVGAQILAPQFLGENFVIGDLTKPLTEQSDKLNRKFDIVFSVEVYEHIHKQHESDYVKNIVMFDPDFLVISCALEDQKGRHHYNKLPFIEFLRRLEQNFPNMEFDMIASMSFQRLPKLRYFYRYNTVVMKKRTKIT